MNRKQRRAAAKQINRVPIKSAGRATEGGNALAQVEELFAAAVAHHQSGRLAEAEAIYRKNLAIHPDHVGSLHLLGVIAHQVGQSGAAVELIGKAISLNNDYAEAHSNMGHALSNLGRLTEAEASFRRALAINPDYAEAHSNLGQALFNLGRFDEAEASYRRALSIRPDFAIGYSNLGNALFKLGRSDEAEASYRRALEINPNYADAYNNLGNVLRDLGQPEEARTAYRRALEIKPDFVAAYSNLGNTLRDLGRFDEAGMAYQRALAINPDFAEAHSNLGHTFFDLGRFDKAEVAYRRALELKPDTAEAHSNLGNILCDLGRLDEAEASHLRALEIKPDSAEVHSNLGNILCDLGRLDEAKAAYRRGLEIKPDFAGGYYSLGVALGYMDEPSQAADAFKNAARIDPDNIGLDATVYLAILDYLNGNIDQCREQLHASQPITEKVRFGNNNISQYWGYLNKLLDWHQQDDRKHSRTPSMKTLHVIGESHALAIHGMNIRYNEHEMRCQSDLIIGCKQWHFGNKSRNKYKHKFNAAMARLPHHSSVLLTIGEIDCRADEGILAALKKNPAQSIDEIVYATAKGYVDFVATTSTLYGHRTIVGGIPAINRPLDTLTPFAAEQLVQLVRTFNATLKDLALTAGMDFLDVYALTDRGDGIAGGERHLDQYHLLPSAMIEAFASYCRLALKDLD